VAHCTLGGYPALTHMCKLAQILLLGLMFIASTGAQSQTRAISEADAQSIRTVIEAQLAAFSADDAQAAFSFASDGIRKTFSTAENFLAMVKASYPVVYRPASVLFLDPEKVADEIMQGVEMSDDTDRLWLAIYRMQRQPDNTWRIDGCVLKSLPGSRS
jgi:hypothetical protein